MHKEETPAQRDQRLRATNRLKTMQSWGYKFEQFMTLDTPTDKEPNVKGILHWIIKLLFLINPFEPSQNL